MPAVIHHPEYRSYDFGKEHPFSPLRVEMLLDLLHSLNLPMQMIEPQPATPEDIRTVHDEEYVRRVEALSAGESVSDCEDFGLGTPDNPIFPGMDLAGRYLAGGTLEAVRMVMSGSENRVMQLGGGLHHARKRSAEGFCIYNDLAIAIRHLMRQGKWVAYLDIDVHHGDGVQEILYEERRAMTISFHESGQYLFPGSGDIHEIGSGPGLGTKLNLPLEPFTDGESYLEVFERVVPAALRQFSPDLLIVQAGADAHFEDSLADLMLTTHDYERLFRRILEYVELYAAGRVVFTLGGGYSLRAAPRVWAILYCVMNDIPIPQDLPPAWLEKWRRQLADPLPTKLHDSLPDHSHIPEREQIAHRNRQNAERLMELMRAAWS